MKNVFKMFVVSLLISAPVYVSAATIKDNFNGPKLSDSWSVATGGEVTVTQSNGSVRIYGPYVGYAQTGGNVLSVQPEPANDFAFSADILEPGANTAAGTYACINVNGDIGNFATVQHYAGGYRLAFGTPNNWNAVSFPEFGDETTTWHTYKIVYDSANKMVTAYVDEKQLGPVSLDLGTSIYYGFYAHASGAGTLLDVLVGNAMLRYQKK